MSSDIEERSEIFSLIYYVLIKTFDCSDGRAFAAASFRCRRVGHLRAGLESSARYMNRIARRASELEKSNPIMRIAAFCGSVRFARINCAERSSISPRQPLHEINLLDTEINLHINSRKKESLQLRLN